MFCTECGEKIADDAIFCINCGKKIATQIQKAQKEEVAVFDNSEKTPAVKFMEPVVMKKEEIVPVEIIESPVMESPMLSPIGIESWTQSPMLESSTQSNQIAGSQMHLIGENQIKKSPSILPLKIISVIFSVLTIISAIIQVIYVISKDGNIGDILWALSFLAAGIVLIAFAIINNKIISRVKGVTFFLLIILDLIFIGFSTIKYAFDELFNAYLNDKEIIYMIVLIVMTISFYIYLLFDGIKAMAVKKGMKTLTIFIAYIPLLATILQIVIKAMHEKKITLMMGFLPINAILVLFLLASMFGNASHRKLH